MQIHMLIDDFAIFLMSLYVILDPPPSITQDPTFYVEHRYTDTQLPHKHIGNLIAQRDTAGCSAHFSFFAGDAAVHLAGRSHPHDDHKYYDVVWLCASSCSEPIKNGLNC